MFLSICAKQNLAIFQADAKAAFLQAPLTEDIYMRAPLGYITVNDKGNDVILKLNKAVYGLKQASACFWTAVSKHLVEIGYHSLTGDTCLFQRTLVVVSESSCVVTLMILFMLCLMWLMVRVFWRK